MVLETSITTRKLQEDQYKRNTEIACNFLNLALEPQTQFTPKTLINSLKDGVYLCHLMNKISPKSVPLPTSQTSPKSNFKQIENISFFLQAASRFGLESHELFETVDLFENRNPKQVIVTLLALQRSIPPLLITSSSPTKNNNNTITTTTTTTSKQSTIIPETNNNNNNNINTNRITIFGNNTNDVIANYQIGSCIGKGQFGSVYKALDLENGEIVAIKRIPLLHKDKSGIKQLKKEVDLLKRLEHPNIVKYYGFVLDNDYMNIILEYVENGSLLNLIKTFTVLPETLVVKYVVQVLFGLYYLHDQGVVHCDLKAANILTTKGGYVKLADFGVAKQLSVLEKESDNVVVGTPNWMAPEIISLDGFHPLSDIWSLGCTIIELVTGKPPYSDLAPMTALFKIVEDPHPPLPKGISLELQGFLQECFQKDPNDRPSATDLLDHALIRKHYRQAISKTSFSGLNEKLQTLSLASFNNNDDNEKETYPSREFKTVKSASSVLSSNSSSANSISTSTVDSNRPGVILVQNNDIRTTTTPLFAIKERTSFSSGSRARRSSFDSAIGTMSERDLSIGLTKAKKLSRKGTLNALFRKSTSSIKSSSSSSLQQQQQQQQQQELKDIVDCDEEYRQASSSSSSSAPQTPSTSRPEKKVLFDDCRYERTLTPDVSYNSSISGSLNGKSSKLTSKKSSLNSIWRQTESPSPSPRRRSRRPRSRTVSGGVTGRNSESCIIS